MKVYRTAAVTAAWRKMANVDLDSVKYLNLPTRIFAYLLGVLDPNSVATIEERTTRIGSLIKKLNPKCIVEIGAGFSSRQKRFQGIKFYELDLAYFQKFKNNLIPFEIGKDRLNLDIKNALFIVEGVSMYLQKEQLIGLLRQIKKYKGSVLIDFFNKEYSKKEKSLRERFYKLLFKLLLKKNNLFDFRIENPADGTELLKNLGYKNVKYYTYNIPKTLDVLFYAEL